MPTSNLHVAPLMCDLVHKSGARRVLDFGPGHGKFGVLLREYAGVTEIDAVEAWEPYVTEFGLQGIYDHVHVGDGLQMSDEDLASYDLVFMSEVIEHVPKADGLAFLERCPGWVVISTPSNWFQEDHEVPTERHRSLWSLEDFGRARIDEGRTEHGGVFVRLLPRS